MTKKELKNKIEKIKRETCIKEVQEILKDYTGEETEKELEIMLEKADCEIISYRINNF